MLRLGFSALVALLLYTEITLAADDVSKRAETCEKRYLESKAGESHAMCLPSSPKLKSSGVSEADKETIVNLHNAERKIVSPKATNMLKMFWDEGIAKIAQAWANTCPEYGPNAHGKAEQRSDPGRYPSVGQNMAWGTNSWTSAFSLWANEKKDYDYAKNTNTSVGKVVGHYTQVVWADSYKVGCGYSECDTRIYVCNYAPGGNMKGAWPYKSGSSCADCTNKCIDGLCDCGDITCYADGKREFKIQDCSCNCKYNLVAPDCTVDCSNVNEPSYCTTWPSSCKYGYQYKCAYHCNECPRPN